MSIVHLLSVAPSANRIGKPALRHKDGGQVAHWMGDIETMVAKSKVFPPKGEVPLLSRRLGSRL
jgi:hypothetical protein